MAIANDINKTSAAPVAGMFIEPMYFATLTFNEDITANGFGVPGSALEQALRVVGTRAVITGVSKLYDGAVTAGTMVDVILGGSQGHTVADPATDLSIDGLKDVAVGGTVTFTATFATFSGLTASTAADLVVGEDGLARPEMNTQFK